MTSVEILVKGFSTCEASAIPTCQDKMENQAISPVSSPAARMMWYL